MADNLVHDIQLTSPLGINLSTAGTYCDRNIQVTPVLEEQTIVPSTVEKIIVPTDGKVGLAQVTVEAVQVEEKTVTTNGDVVPSSGKYLSKVSVNIPIPEEYDGAITIA